MTNLEQELARQLCPVRAPDDLWDRIHEQRRPLRVSRRALGPGAQLAAMALVILTTGFAMRFAPAPARPQAYIDIDIPQLTSCTTAGPSLLSARLISWKGQPFLPAPRLQANCVLCHTEPGHATSVAF
jgi:hypothetical protein